MVRSNPECFEKLSDFLSTTMTIGSTLKNLINQNMADEQKLLRVVFLCHRIRKIWLKTHLLNRKLRLDCG